MTRHDSGTSTALPPLQLLIERAESTGEGISEGLTLSVRGFPDSSTMGRYFAHAGIKVSPSEPGNANPSWWDLFFGGADAGIAYAPEDGLAKIEIESSAALARGLPLATIEGRQVVLGDIPDLRVIGDRLPVGYGVEGSGLLLGGRRVGTATRPETVGSTSMAFQFEEDGVAEAFYKAALARGHVAVAKREIADLVNRYITRHHRAAHEDSHVTRNVLIGVGAIGALVGLIIAANAMSGGKLSKATHNAAVRMGIRKEPKPAYVVGDTGSLVKAGNVIGIGNVYLEFPERKAQAGDTVAVELPTVSTGDRVYTSVTTRPDSSGGIVQIIVARIADERGNVRYQHPLGAFPVPSYKLIPREQWGPETVLDSLGPDYVAVMEARAESSKRIRVTGMLTKVSDESGTRFVVASGSHSIVLEGTIDGLTGARLEQLRDKPVDVTGNIIRILSGAFQGRKPSGQPMLAVNPQGVMPGQGR